MARTFLLHALMLVALSTLLSCSSKHEEGGSNAMHGAYYWSTTFALDSTKQQFIDRHNIKRLYVRYFDVVADDNSAAKPNATILFDSVAGVPPSIEVVPTVFIHNECMASDSAASQQWRSALAHKILSRILQISETHGISRVKEIQIDCDWTARTRAHFYALLEALRSIARDKDIALSATIRLHQLSQAPPPVDRGVLMVYNTGDMRRLDVEKPILDPAEVKKYARGLPNYNLPLSIALPIYKWELLFRGGNFVDILHSPGELPVIAGDSIVTRVPTVEDIIISRDIICSLRPDCADEIILFDLNNYNINRYTDEEFKSIYN